jgi:chromosomal replication initiation ATPase DnaA
MNQLEMVRYIKATDIANVLGVSRQVLCRRLKAKNIPLKNGKFYVEHLDKVLRPNIKPAPPNELAFKFVETLISERFQIPINILIGDYRARKYTDARHLLWYVLNEKYKLSMNRIRRHYNRSEGSIYFGIRKVINISSYDKDFNETLKSLL